MTVKELIEELSQYPEDMKVFCGADYCESTEELNSVSLGEWKWNNHGEPYIMVGSY